MDNNLYKKLSGSIVALVTPMQKRSKSIDYQRFTTLINWHIQQHTQAIVVAGSTGESTALNTKEWVKLLEIAKQTADRKIAIIAGTGTNYTKTAISKALLAQHIGVDAALIVTPYYNKPTQQGLKLHFSSIARKVCNMPIILYNVPSRTGCDLLPSTTEYLSKIANIVGIKEASNQITRVAELRKLCHDKFLLLSGNDNSFVDFCLRGGDGVVSVVGNVVPEIVAYMCKLLKLAIINSKEYLKIVLTINQNLATLYDSLMIESNPIPVKWLLGHLGKIEPVCRLPLTMLSKQYHQKVLVSYEIAISTINNLNFDLLKETNAP